MKLFRLIRTITLRHLFRERGKLLLSVSGVALGVAVFVAIRLANNTALEAFRSSLDVVAGRADLQAVSSDGNGFDESLIAKLRQSKAVEAAAPVIEQYAQVDDSLERASAGMGTPILVFGVDILSENKFRTYQFSDSGLTQEAGLQFLLQRNAIIITSKLAAQLHLKRGDSIHIIASGKRLAFNVVNIITPEGTASALGGNFAMLDIASAQEMFGRNGRLDRIDLLVPENQVENVREYLQADLPQGITLQAPQSRGEQTMRMLGAFSLNLTALAFIALFVSMFIIYNTMLTSALRRRRELGILRATGATRGTIVAMMLAEAFVLGLIGVVIGVPLGVLLAKIALSQVIRTVTALYILTVAKNLIIDPMILGSGVLIGIGVSLLSAIPSAIEASRVHPRETFAVQALEKRVVMSYTRIAIASALVLIAGYVASLEGQAFTNPLLGFASAGLVLVGFALLAPVFIRLSDKLFRPLIKRIFGIEGVLANAYLLQSPGRSSTAIAALMTAIAMLIGISTMVGSFRKTVEYWMRQSVTADIYLTVSNNRLAASNVSPVPDEVVRYVDSLPEVYVADALKRIRTTYRGRTITVGGARLNVPESLATLSFIRGDWSQIRLKMNAGEIAASEAFGMRFKKNVGDTIVLATPNGPQAVTIAGLFYDYTSDAGSIVMRKDYYSKLYSDTTTSNVALYMRNRATLDGTITKILQRFGGKYSLLAYSNATLREEVLNIFDQTFAITYALQLVAIIVAAIGVANTLSALVMERSREIGIMKAIGASAAQIRKMTLVQAGLIALASEALGIVAGLALSAVLIYVINRVSFGWTIQFQLSPAIFASSAGLVLVTAMIAALLPARNAAHKSVAEVVRAE